MWARRSRRASPLSRERRLLGRLARRMRVDDHRVLRRPPAVDRLLARRPRAARRDVVHPQLRRRPSRSRQASTVSVEDALLAPRCRAARPRGLADTIDHRDARSCDLAYRDRVVSYIVGSDRARRLRNSRATTRWPFRSPLGAPGRSTTRTPPSSSPSATSASRRSAGRFTGFDASIVVADDQASATIRAEVDLSSVDTDNADRDAAPARLGLLQRRPPPGHGVRVVVDHRPRRRRLPARRLPLPERANPTAVVHRRVLRHRDLPGRRVDPRRVRRDRRAVAARRSASTSTCRSPRAGS